MDSVKQYQVLPSVWIKVWIGIGIAGAVLGLVVLLNMAAYAVLEMERKEDCEAGVRQDCEPSFVWFFDEDAKKAANEEEEQAALKQESSEKIDVQYESGIRQYRTGMDSPEAAGIEVRGAAPEDNWYVVEAGSELEILVRPEGDFERVELYVHPKLTLVPGIGIHEGSFQDQGDGTYLAVYRVPANLEADLEVRVQQNADIYGSAFIQVRSR